MFKLHPTTELYDGPARQYTTLSILYKQRSDLATGLGA